MDDDNDKLSSSKKKKDAQSYWEAIVSNRDTANSLLSDGTTGQNLFEKMATLNINYRINEERYHRCPRCWYCSTRCVCDSMPDRIDKDELSTTNVKILLLMHHKEYLNAGNSAKSLIALLPAEYLTLYVYGREGDFDRCIDEMMINHGRHTAILWPGESAISVEEFISTKSSDEKMMESEGNDGSVSIDKKKQDIKEGDDDKEEETTNAIFRIVALDGTYKNAKNMYKSIRQRLGEKVAQQDMPSCIALHPKSVSKFHRAKKNYGAAIHDNLKANNKLDETALRVSTAEACALLLTELGAAESVQEKIIKALLVNNCNRN